jgi:hypothetical protein
VQRRALQSILTAAETTRVAGENPDKKKSPEEIPGFFMPRQASMYGLSDATVCEISPI